MGVLDGRVAIVTGAGGGIGREHALAFAGEGAKVVVNDLGVDLDGGGGSSGPAERVVAEIQAAGGTAIANTDSVADYESAGLIVSSAVAAFGQVDILVNNASVFRDGPFETMTPDDSRLSYQCICSARSTCASTPSRSWSARDGVGWSTRRRAHGTPSVDSPPTPRPRPASSVSRSTSLPSTTATASPSTSCRHQRSPSTAGCRDRCGSTSSGPSASCRTSPTGRGSGTGAGATRPRAADRGVPGVRRRRPDLRQGIRRSGQSGRRVRPPRGGPSSVQGRHEGTLDARGARPGRPRIAASDLRAPHIQD